jgi:pimeloyl-ACP methyl ester carboxylesterase
LLLRFAIWCSLNDSLPPISIVNIRLRRRITEVDGRRVHWWSGGRGPAVLLIHGSPGNAWLVKPLAERLARHFSVHAVDSPGFGLSDSLPAGVESVAQLADAYRDLMDVLGLTNALVYGTHSGAAIGLELAYRHPERIPGFVLDGVPAFTPEEQRPLLAPDYLAALEPEALGGHYTRAWTRFRDQFVWFPWYQRDPAHLNEAFAGTASDIHLWVEMYFQALRHDYRPAYRAVIRYGSGALAAAGALRMPGVYLAERSDMLFPHLDRLPPLAPGQRIERVMDPDDVAPAVEAALLSLPPSAVAPPAAPLRAGTHLHDLPDGQLWVRSHVAGRGTPVLLLHDAPGGGRNLISLYHALAAQGPVILPDLPGCGESDPLAAGRSSLSDHADAVASLVAAYTHGAIHIHGVGVGAALALELSTRHPELVRSVTVTGLLRTTGAQRRAMIGRLAPPIRLEDDGRHWYRTWLMLRDSLVRWPWYDRAPAALRRQHIDLDPAYLHAWTCDVMRQWSTYHQVIDAVLEWDPELPLECAAHKMTVAIDPQDALCASDLDWAAGGAKSLTLPDDPADRARVILGVVPRGDDCGRMAGVKGSASG